MLFRSVSYYGVVKLSLCLTNQALCHEGLLGSGCMDPLILDLGIKAEVSGQLHARTLYSQGKPPPPPVPIE
jgi:hypothetical protein